MTPEILSLVRSVLSVLGTLLVTFGIVGQDEVGPLIENIMVVVGGIAVVGAAIWGVYQKWLQKKQVAVAMIAPATKAAVAEAATVLTTAEIDRAMNTTAPPAKVGATGRVT